MPAIIKERVSFVGTQDWERKLFDEIIPLPDGTSYNSYLIEGSKKTALIDTADPRTEYEFLEKIREFSIDYVIANHAEQDHSGAIPKVLEMFPNAKVVTNEKCKEFLKDLLFVPEEKFIVVKDGDELSLGDKTLKFFLAPWVHWPETMFTYLKEDKILFTCDFLGAHLASNSLFVEDEHTAYEAAKRYYSEIMMPFRTFVKNNLEIVKKILPEIIAPSHGQLHKNTKFIIEAYDDWSSDKVKNEVLIPFVSMHGSTAKMVEHLAQALEKHGVEVKVFNLTETDIGELAKAMVDAATIVIATPTMLAGPHPTAIYGAVLANALRPKTRFAGIIGSYGWGGKTVDILKSALSGLKIELLEPVLVKGYPKEADLKKLDALADEIKKRHSQI